MATELQQYKAETAHMRASAAASRAGTSQLKAEEKLETTKLKLLKAQGKKKKRKSYLDKRLKKPKKIFKHEQLTVDISERNAPYIPTFMTYDIEEEKRSMFFS